LQSNVGDVRVAVVGFLSPNLRPLDWAAFFLAILAASLTIHPFGDGGTVKPWAAYWSSFLFSKLRSMPSVLQT
jgi:hypothetical protein